MTALLIPRPRDARRRDHSLIDVTLDPTQRAAVERPGGDALLVLGEAGHGKTTVALHRLAHLWRASASPLTAAVIVPTEGLARLLQPLLRRLGVDVDVLTYDRWSSRQARRAFRRLPREAEGSRPSVVRMKRHPALRTAIEEIARRAPGVVDDDADADRRARPVRAQATRGDLQHLFGDRVLLERVAAQGRLSSLCVADTLERTRVQFAKRAEVEWADVTDRRRLVAIDGRALDDGTSSEHATTIDVEDYAVLFEIDRLRAASSGRAGAAPKTYDVVMIDEAQELATLELVLVGRSLSPAGTLIVAGDADQQVEETTTFRDWGAVMAALGRKAHDVVRLDIGYRCPPAVVALANAALGRAACGRTDPPFEVHAFRDEAAFAAALGRDLERIALEDPGASVAVLCRGPMTARRVVSSQHAAEIPARLVFDGRFLARGPVQVTTVDEVKGLEFDFVIVPDLDARSYPDEAAARRALYVAVTRARHQVALARVGEPSPVAQFAP